MKNYFIYILTFLFSHLYQSQVGIDVTDPKATLDVAANPTNLSKIDGMIAPRLSGNELKAKDALYGINQNAAIVFATSAASPVTPKTIEITKAGYYYYDAILGKWMTFQSSTGTGTINNIIDNPLNTITSMVNGISSNTKAVNAISNAVSATNFLTTTVNGVASTPVVLKNIYNSDGTLTSSRYVTLDGKRFYLMGTSGHTAFTNDDTGASILNYSATKRSDFLLTAGSSDFQFFVDPNSAAQIFAGRAATSLIIRTSQTNAAAPISFSTSTGSSALGQQRAEIAGDGKFNIVNSLSVGYNSQQTFTGTQKLKVNGSIVTTSNTYPDYVFEKYFTGNSIIKPDYHFKNLDETKNFVKENHHLPGIISIKDLQKSEDGYDVDMTQLSIQQLEKIEELYLHTFEQEETIKQQQSEINDLKLRLEKLEIIVLK